MKKWLLSIFIYVSIEGAALSDELNIPYFAYGSNLSYEFLKERLKDGPWTGDWERSGCLIGKAPIDLGSYWLDDYEFGYTLDIVPFGEIGTAANIAPKEGARVYGVLYMLSERQLAELDVTEDIPEAYTRVAVKINRLVTNRFNSLESITAWAYIGNPKYVITDLTPDPAYVKLIVKGAKEHDLPEAYILNQLVFPEPALAH